MPDMLVYLQYVVTRKLHDVASNKLRDVHYYSKQLEGAHESAYLCQVLAFNAKKFRGSRDSSHAPFG